MSDEARPEERAAHTLRGITQQTNVTANLISGRRHQCPPLGSASACTAEASGAACRGGKFLDSFEVAHRNRRDDQLGDAIAVLDPEWLGAEVDEDDLEFTTVVGIDCTRRIGDRDTVS